MAFQSVPECAEAVINMQGQGGPLVNVLGFWKPGGYVQADIDALANAVDIVVGVSFLPLMHGGIAYLNTLVRGLQNSVDLTATDSSSAGNGTAGGAACPSNAAFVITHRTGLTGRSARGRSYMGGVSAANQTSADTVSSGFAANWATAFAGIKSAAFANGWVFSVISRQNANAVRPTGVHFTITNSVARNLDLDSQRGRLVTGH